ncbi:UNC93-like protein C922.05c [Serendipita indica DSM 11827]|nr:UNC93-like protein C922.05c [Serendipita indica DSM 11827]
MSEKGGRSSESEHDQHHVHDAAPQRTGAARIYYHPLTQVVLLGLVLFMTPGMFNALNGLGAGGQVDSQTSANANSTLYATFAFTAFFAGSINNKLGSRLTLFIGSLGYSLYIASYLAMEIHSNAGPFVITAGAILGICAGLIWTAHGAIILSLPTESQKGLYISICWSLFNLGAVVGAAVALGQNINSRASAVGTPTYIGFLVLTLIGAIIPLFMVPTDKMYRTDGSRVTISRNPSWKVEFTSLFYALYKDPLIVLLLPMFWASNWFYTWQFNAYNAALFDMFINWLVGARSVNNFVYWLSQILGSVIIGVLLDSKNMSRRMRAFLGWGILTVMVFVVHIWAYFYQKDYTREQTEAKISNISIYTIKATLLVSGFTSSLAYFTGLYKSIQSAGGAVAWRADGLKVPYMNLFISTWVLLAAGLVFALPMLHLRVKNHTDLEDEVIARMDDSGRILNVEEAEQKLGTVHKEAP